MMIRDPSPRHGLARILSKRGVLSRRAAAELIRAGRVAVAGRVVRDPEWPTALDAEISLDGLSVFATERVVLAINKRRGWLCTARDERGRPTVYEALRDGPDAPWLAPVGRLDRASEGLLLMSNDTALAARILDPERGPAKTYHLKLRGRPDPALPARWLNGIWDHGERLRAKDLALLREGPRSFWLAVRLKGGRNRQLRRMAAADGLTVERLVRIAIGGLALGDLPKGRCRRLAAAEIERLFAEPPLLSPPSV